MKKTVKLTNLIKAKSDLELHIKVAQIKTLKTLFDPDFDLKDANSKIDDLEDQLIIIKEAIQLANSTTNDDTGKSINNSIYLLSKYNRKRSDLKLYLEKIGVNGMLDNDSFKEKLLKDIREMDDLIVKETDKKRKSELESNKRRLKRSFTKISANKKESPDLKGSVESELTLVEKQINELKSKLAILNEKTTVEVEISDGFSLIIN